MEAEDPHLNILFSTIRVTITTFDLTDLLLVVVLILLLISSALLSGSEVAYFSLSPSDISGLKHSRKKRDQLLLQLYHRPEYLLGTILVGNNFVNIAIVIFTTFLTNRLVDFSQARTLGILVQVVGITFLLLLFGEIMPKIYATQKRISWARLMAWPLKITSWVFYPLIVLLVSSTSIIKKRLARKNQNISIDELSDALELSSEGALEDEKILKGITKFGNLDVQEIMTPRVDIFAIDIRTPFRRLLSEIIREGYSRVPVYNKTFDHVKGVLYIKDILPHLHKKDSFKWQTLIRPPYFVPESKKINDLLEEFQLNKIHIAIVIDEYGGTSGIVTLEDIIEEIVGEIADEHDDEEELYRKTGENRYLFEGKILLNDFSKVLHLEDDYFDEIRGEAETLAGLILELRGKIPEKGETLRYRHFTFQVRDADKRRIKKIEVIRIPESAEEKEES